MIKKLFVLFGIVIGILVAVVVVAALMIDPLVKKGVEYGSTTTLKVPTHLGGAKVRFKGKLDLDRFEVANPAGFKEPKAIVFDHLDLEVRPRELFQPVVNVQQLRIVKPEVTLEFVG